MLQSGILVYGETEAGSKFRPSDWIDRVSSLGATYHHHRLVFSQELRPIFLGHKRCLYISDTLLASDARLYHQVLHFAGIHHLKKERLNDSMAV